MLGATKIPLVSGNTHSFTFRYKRIKSFLFVIVVYLLTSSNFSHHTRFTFGLILLKRYETP